MSRSLLATLLGNDEESASGAVQTLDRSDAADLTRVLDAMQSIANEFVLPVALLQSRTPDGGAYFDLDRLAGYDYPGLISGLLKERFPTLSPTPPEPDLANELQEAGFDIESANNREAFFSGWMATRAQRMLGALADYLDETRVAWSGEQLDKLEALVRADLSAAIRERLADILLSASAERARQVGASVAEAYLRDLLLASA